MEKSRFSADAETMNALIDALGAMTLVLLSRMPIEDRQGAANDFMRLAASAEKRGDVTLGTLLVTLHQAAQSAAR